MTSKLGDWITQNPFAPRSDVSLADALRGLRLGRGNTEASRRKQKGQQSLKAFCDTYLAHHFTSSYGEHLDDLFLTIEKPSPIHKGKKVVRVEPRMHGKTTVISLALPLYCL